MQWLEATTCDPDFQYAVLSRRLLCSVFSSAVHSEQGYCLQTALWGPDETNATLWCCVEALTSNSMTGQEAGCLGTLTCSSYTYAYLALTFL